MGFSTSYTTPPAAQARIKSTQQISGAFGNNTNDTLDITITAVTVDNTILYASYAPNTGTAERNALAWELTSSTNVRLYRECTNAAVSGTVYITVEEYNPGIILKQTGTITINGVTSNTGTINAVNTSKTKVIYSGATNGDTGANTSLPTMAMAGVVLTNSTTITAYVGNAPTPATTVYYQVVEEV